MRRPGDDDALDALDAVILRQLGVEPFAGLRERPKGLRATDVARSLGRNVRLVQDRITRMEQDGVITGYAMVPNPRHLGLGLTTLYVPTEGAAEPGSLAGLADLDGFVQVIAYLGEGMCLSLSHASAEERDRRISLISRLEQVAGEPRPMYVHDLPKVSRELTPLDWRIIASLGPAAKRSVTEVAEEIGVTPKTLRTRLQRMRDEGSVDEVAKLDFSRMTGVMPFEIAVWCDDAKAVAKRIVKGLSENYWGHFMGPPSGYCDVLVRVFTTTPAEAQGLVRVAGSIPGVERAEALMGAGAHDDPGWLMEAIAARLQVTAQG